MRKRSRDSKSETWIPAAGHSRYEVSDLGRVRNACTKKVREEVESDRYIRMPLDGKTVKVHRLVLLSFVGPDPNRPYALHDNGDTTDNRLSNLYWGIQADNYEDTRRHGTAPTGERHGGSKLTEEAVMEIMSTPKKRGSGRELARKFGISEQRVCDIRNGRGWVSIKEGANGST